VSSGQGRLMELINLSNKNKRIPLVISTKGSTDDRPLNMFKKYL
jgi:hypothetical protein